VPLPPFDAILVPKFVAFFQQKIGAKSAEKMPLYLFVAKKQLTTI
jgi:hypothetical protein